MILIRKNRIFYIKVQFVWRNLKWKRRNSKSQLNEKDCGGMCQSIIIFMIVLFKNKICALSKWILIAVMSAHLSAMKLNKGVLSFVHLVLLAVKGSSANAGDVAEKWVSL